MPMFLNSLNEFYNGLPLGIKSNNATLNQFQSLLGVGKSIQKSYRFFVTFFPPRLMATNGKVYAHVGKMPNIKEFHVKNISIPQYTYKKETQYYGPVPRSFPVLEHDGFEVKIEFEEDDRGTIGNFISWLQRLAINPKDGTYTPPDFVKLQMIGVVAESDLGIPIACYTLHDPFYMSATGPDFDYSDNSAIKYSISFNVDVINSFFPQSFYFSKVTSLLTGGLL